MRRRPAARKAGHSQIKAAPEEMDRAHLAEKASAKEGKDAVRLDQDAPEAVRELGVIGGMLLVVLKADRMRDFHRHIIAVPYGSFNLQLMKENKCRARQNT